MGKWIADFETTTTERRKFDNTSHVWAVGLCEVGNPSNTKIMTTIEEFFEWCEKQKDNEVVYFHNLRFDGNFITQWLLKHGYKHALNPDEKGDRTFSTVISDMGLWYQIEIYFKFKGRNVKKVTILDSLKLIPLSVRAIAKSFKLEIQKGHIDYAAHDLLPIGSPLTPEEEEYLLHDVQIVEHAVNFFQEQGLTKMTIGACALEEYKAILSKKYFKMYFPPPFYDEDVRDAYKGGFTYLNPEFKEKMLGVRKPISKSLIIRRKKRRKGKKSKLTVVKTNPWRMVILDVNSLYPSVMAGCNGEILPYGTPVFYEGEYVPDERYPLYIQKIRCMFKLKPGKIPTVQLKKHAHFIGNQYLTSSDGREETLYLTSVDLKLFLEQYDTYNLEYLKGWKFKAVEAGVLFGEYVNKWSEVKINSKKEGNHGMYLIAKLFLNSLYGKFGTATKVKSKIPYLDDDGKLKFKMSEEQSKDGVYIAMACFITAWARDKTIRAAQAIEDNFHSGKSRARFVYADTDSLHIDLNGMTEEEFFATCPLDIHPTKLGAWDHEATASQAKFLRQKCYVEKHIISEKSYNAAMADDDTVKECYGKDKNGYYFMKITVAGMPDSCYKHVTFNNFAIGASYPGKLMHKTVDGGVVLENIDFSIKM